VELADAINAAVPGCDATTYESFGGTVLVVRADRVADVLAHLRDDPAYACNMLADVTAVDHVASEGTIHVVYVLRSLSHRQRYLVKVKVPVTDPVVPTVSHLWKSANWAEREVWDMFGVRFEGHPDLRRILLYPQFEGHPLRKAYPFQKRQPLVEERDPIVNPWPSRDGL